MTGKFQVTYEIVTPESAERGGVEECGFLNSRCLPVEALIGRQTPGVDLTLREAVGLVSAPHLEDSGTWFTEIDGRHDYRTGAEERRSLPPPQSITEASYARLRRILCGK